tara:strand:+ start:38 stop:490 length:453 start_codon:yes stop_codon:yes gene_type:complete
MTCVNNCLISFVLFFSIVATMINSKTSPKHKHFRSLLNKNQTNIYDNIHKERLTIYLIGLCVGIVVAFFASNFLSSPKSNKLCLFVAIAISVNVVIYMVYPKSQYILTHLKEGEQVDAWLDIYKDMKLKKMVGAGVGLVAYYLMGNGLID